MARNIDFAAERVFATTHNLPDGVIVCVSPYQPTISAYSSLFINRNHQYRSRDVVLTLRLPSAKEKTFRDRAEAWVQENLGFSMPKDRTRTIFYYKPTGPRGRRISKFLTDRSSR